MKKVLSVSVAAYNLERLLSRCLDSFLPEPVLNRVEVIVTDDGSSDNTAQTARDYCLRYPETFRLITQKNSGPGSTVNSGIRNASGEYFRMVDGDDWVDAEGMGKLLDFLETHSVDMVCTPYITVDEHSGERKCIPAASEKFGEVIKAGELLSQGRDLSMHNVVFRTSVLRENGIILDNGFYTDMEYLLFPMFFVSTASALECPVYMYRVGDVSQSMSIKSLQKREDEHLLVLDHLVRAYEKRKNEVPALSVEPDPGRDHFIAWRIAQ
ncbi:MAG: glycosyltransferase family 2 protein, partial [Parasporobacterium sp.]|nr:glycosyltransferase family 2 protein [Parasporobacterium sp.]